MILVTAKGTDRIGWLLRNGCGDALSVFSADADTLEIPDRIPDIIYLGQTFFQNIKCENAVFIIRGASGFPGRIDCQNAVAIIDSSDPAAMELVSQRHLRTITCGLSVSSTFTFSSLTTDSAVISLQRTITAFDGSEVEPFELPVDFTNVHIDPVSLLSCAAVFCLCGIQNPLSGLKCWRIPSRSI